MSEPAVTDEIEKAGRKRIFFFYNRPAQLRYAATALLIIFTTIVTYTYLLFSKVSKVMDVESANVRSVERYAVTAMQELISTITWGSAVCLLVAGGMSAIWAMLLTHRYEGPIVRINRHLNDLANGDYSGRLTVRKADEVATLVATVNLLTEKLDERKKKSEST